MHAHHFLFFLFPRQNKQESTTIYNTIKSIISSHTSYKNKKKKKKKGKLRERGKEALGETTELIEQGFLVTVLVHIKWKKKGVETVRRLIPTNR